MSGPKEGTMPLVRRIANHVLKLSLAAPLLLFLQDRATAGLLHPFCHRKSCCEIRDCEFYGYYPTCWRRWPANWPGCGACPEAVPAEMPPANGQQPEFELLPPPAVGAKAPASLPSIVEQPRSVSPYLQAWPTSRR